MNILNEKLKVETEQIKHLYSSGIAVQFISASLAAIFVLMQAEMRADPIAITWLALIILASLGRTVLIIAYKGRQADSPNNTWLKRWRFGALISGLLWGLIGLLLLSHDDPQQQVLIIFFIAGVSAAGLVANAADYFSAIAYPLAATTPLVISLFIVGDQLSIAMGVAGLLYLGFLIVIARHIHLNLFENITLRLNAVANEEVLRIGNERYQAILDGAMDGFWLLDSQGHLLEVNETYCQMSGYSEQELLSMRVSDLEAAESAQETAAHIQIIIQKGEDRFESQHRRKDGSVFFVEVSVQYRSLAGGQFVVFIQDITSRKLARDEIERLAYYDPLTQLPNRRLLFVKLTHALASSARSGKGCALLYLDLDNFKKLNDHLGHAMGDLLLQQVAQRLNASLRQTDTIARIARLGGDEFVIILEILSEHELEAKTQSNVVGKKILSALSKPYQLATHIYQTTASIGIALFNKNESCEGFLKRADIAMYQAKKAGRNSICFFDQQMQNAMHAELVIEHELRTAIDKQQLLLHYQIQVGHLNQPLGAEALIRWLHPERGLLPPFQFIAVAEETGLILPLGKWVLETACNQLKSWQQNELTRNLTLSINVSAKQFHQQHFVEQVQATVLKNNVNPALLKMELTESMLLHDIDSTIETMNALKEIGVQFSLDDFGTGFSSLQYLKRLPLNQLKIDQSFVCDIAVDSSDQAIVQTIIAMAKTLKLNVIAEGVETKEQQALLLASGCKQFQGYLFSKPVPIKEFERKLKPKG